MIQLLRIDKYLRIFSKKTDFFQYGAKEEKHSNDLRTLVINHYLNGDSQREIANEGVVESTSSVIDNKEVQEYYVYWKVVWSRSQT